MVSRRRFIQELATATGAVVLVPAVSRCGSSAKPAVRAASTPAVRAPELLPVPMIPTQDWDALAFNRKRGNQGAIPASYLPDINGSEGDTKHLGKHLPFVPDVSGIAVPSGYLAIMWGDPDKGHAPHPNAEPGPENNNEGHWYNWIKVRKATTDTADEAESTYASWPVVAPGDSGAYAAPHGADPSDDDGRKTIYLAALPADVKPGDRVRIWAHCLTHGEYVDFLTLPV